MAISSQGATETIDLAQKVREHLVSTVKQGQQLSVNATQTFVQALPVFPVVDLPAVPGVPAVPDLEAVTTFTFDVLADLFKAQRDFALQLANVLVPKDTA